MIHYLATTNCLSISLAAVSVGMIMFTPIAGAMLAIPLMTNFTLHTVIIAIEVRSM
jgi:hypothetical protein